MASMGLSGGHYSGDELVVLTTYRVSTDSSAESKDKAVCVQSVDQCGRQS